MKRLLLASAAILSSNLAMAADDVVGEAFAETNFGGFYIGTEVAYSLSNSEISVGSGPENITLDGFGGRGGSIGGFVGYDHVYDNGFLLGAQLGAHVSDIGASVSVSDGSGGFGSAELKTDWFATVSARAGYLVNPDTLVYGSLGATVAHGVGSYAFDISGTADSDSDEEFFYGVAFGALGVETVLSGRVRARFEYIASYLNTQTFTFDDAGLDVTPLIGTAKLGLVYDFGEPRRINGQNVMAPESWSGFYAGITGGQDVGVSEYSLADGAPIGAGGAGFNFDGFGSDGYAIGVVGGYNRQFGSHIVAGIEAGIAASNVKNKISVSLGGDSGSLEMGTSSSYNARLRLGVLANPSTLIYGYGGISRQRMYARLSEGPDSMRESMDIDAVEFGGGVETWITDRLTLRGEYGLVSYEDYGDPESMGEIDTTLATARISTVFHF